MSEQKMPGAIADAVLNTPEPDKWIDCGESRPLPMFHMHTLMQYGERCAEAALAWLRSQAEPVATLHDDGHFTFKKGKETHESRYAGWRMDVFAAPQPAIPDGWQAIETYDGMKKKPAHAVFWFEGTAPARGQLGKYGLPPMMSLERIRGSRICTHWMPLPLAPEPRK